MAEGSNNDDNGDRLLQQVHFQPPRVGDPGFLHEGARRAFETTHKPAEEEQHRRQMELVKAKQAHQLECIRIALAAAFLTGAAAFFWSHPEVWNTSTGLVSATVGAIIGYLFSKKS